MIEVKNVKKRFIKNVGKKAEEIYAVDDISFEVPDGTIYGILGQNGAGKTTLLRMMSGIMSPTEGTIMVDNHSYDKHDELIKKEISYLSGNTKLYENITPVELLNIFGNIYEIDKDKLNIRIKEIVNFYPKVYRKRCNNGQYFLIRPLHRVKAQRRGGLFL